MRAGLSGADAQPHPLRQFERWFRDALAAQRPLANAMTLATIDQKDLSLYRVRGRRRFRILLG